MSQAGLSSVSGVIGIPVTVPNGGTGRTSFIPYAVITGGTTSTSPLQSVASVGTVGQILTSNGAGMLPSFQPFSGVLTWNTITSANNVQQIVKENGYISTGGVLCTLLLPAAASIGDTFKVTGFSALWQIQQNALQSIYLGSQVTTAGIGGTLTSTNALDHVEIIYVAANSWKVIDSIGNMTVA